ncbi:MAG TPA: apolipoprotein N-acyltransferase [Alphaproteobacteria bacterium]|nr:apolipoprotein N-acyltransferase [Alphaproteobacteria bacterium]
MTGKAFRAAGIPARLAALRGFRRALAAFVLGVVLTAALPPVFALPLAFVAFTGLAWLLDGAREGRKPFRAALITGWWFGFGYFVSGLYWIANALLVDAQQFGWLIPFAIGGLSAYFAVFPACAAAAYAMAPESRAARILVFAGAWTVTEYLRGILFTGFPWNLVASVWTFHPATMQALAFMGAYGLGLFSVLLFAAPSVLAGRARLAAAPMILVALVPFAAGLWRYEAAPASGSDMVPGVKLALVQGDIAQRMKWNPEERIGIVRTYLGLTAKAVADGATHVVWPETAVPVALGRSPELRAAIAGILRSSSTAQALVAGTLRVTAPNEPLKAWNSVQVVGRDGEITATYDKFHLVPFGEYVPFRHLLPLDKITAGSVDFTAGSGPETIAVPGLPPVGPLICYEAIFPGEVTASPRPGVLLNVTNDAWFGDSTGPRQHFEAARMRAVEEGLPLARAAGNGISAIVDPYGRVLDRLDLDRRGIVEGGLPRALTPTLFARLGNGVALALAALSAIAGFALGRLRRGAI